VVITNIKLKYLIWNHYDNLISSFIVLKFPKSKAKFRAICHAVLSVNGEKATMYRGIRHGACDYIVKPADIKETRNIWQHVVRKNHVAVIHNSSDSDDADQRVARPVIAKGGAKSKKCSKKKRNDGEGSDDNRGRRRNTWKKPRVSWTGELHNRFLEVVNRLGIDSKISQFFSLLISPQKNCLRFLDLF
jgi:hypothetical protein